MAQRVEYILVDDLDGGPAHDTVTFALDGVSYEIDLSEENASRLRGALSEWIGHARRNTGRRTTTARRPSAKRTDLSAVREWARGQGYTVSDRGRIAADVQAAYDKAH
ncbi:MAG: Lsr2 family protein [Micrococcales bacterium]|nr:Lsr2 family protein [Micrococcales bacterium]